MWQVFVFELINILIDSMFISKDDKILTELANPQSYKDFILVSAQCMNNIVPIFIKLETILEEGNHCELNNYVKDVLAELSNMPKYIKECREKNICYK